ncbi:MAG: SBBP repeat-containing protein [Bryobacterales bacterium]|nr:SBBP repeat-containing protein [Bryobacterales bacterium]
MRAIFFCCCWLLTQSLWIANAGEAIEKKIAIQSSPLNAPAFQDDTRQEDAKRGSAPRYFWRHGGILTTLRPGGNIAIRLPNGHKFQIAFPGANSSVVPQGELPERTRIFYYLGRADHWRSSGRWKRVRYHDLYPGIDLILFSQEGQLEYNFEIGPGADPGSIKIRYRGAGVRLTSSGNIEIRSHGKIVEQRLPSAFQGDGADRKIVPCHYRVKGDFVTLRLDGYDRGKLLVIDPVLNFSTYLGGPYFDAIYAVTADSAGNLYVAGETSSGSLPGGSLPARSSRDAWVAKMNSAGTELLYVVYLGGSGNDSAKGLAVDSSGNVYIAGITASSDFPVTTGAFSTINTGTQEAFVTKLNSTGVLTYSSYLGGGGSDSGLAIAVDGTGAAYVAGQTSSGNFPVTSGAFEQSSQGGLSDCFVSKLNAAGSALTYSTFLGGGALDLCAGIAIDAWGDAYVTGTTYSSNFPVYHAMQSNLRGSANAFVTELNAAGSALLYSTLLGGSVLENGTAIGVDSTGAAYVTGCTASPDFPTSPAAWQTQLKGSMNGFVSKLSESAGLIYSTYIGGSSSDTATAIAIDSSGQAVIGGYTTSTDFPVVSAIQSTSQGGIDAFAAILSVNASELLFSSYFGGAGDDRIFAVDALPGHGMFLAGMTTSTNFPTVAPLQSSLAGNYDGFAMNGTYMLGQVFIPLTPCRIADTRAEEGFTGVFGPPFVAGGFTRSFPIPASNCGVPATAQAYSLNITVVPHGPLAFLTTWPTGLAMPTASTLNSLSGAVVANAATVQAGAGGAISIYVSNDTDVIIDISGYFAPSNTPQGMEFYPLTPCRIADTRNADGPFGGPEMTAQQTRSFPVASSSCNVPALAQAYSLNMTVVPSGYLAYLSVWPDGESQPLVSTLNDTTGAVVANAAIVPAGANGAVDVFVNNTSNVIMDMNGYFAPPGNTGALYFYPVTPCRVVDTRAISGFTGSFGPPSLAAQVERDFPIAAANCDVPSTAQAYSLNMTVVPPGPMPYLSAWSTGQSQPLVSTLNDLTGNIVANAAIVPAGANGSISVFAYAATDLLIDINGYFAP